MNETPETSDDYVTWAPTTCRIRAIHQGPMTDFHVTLMSTGGAGRVRFAAALRRWPVNTTATQASLELHVPSDGTWRSFVIAGEFGHPSIDDKDASIQIWVQDASGGLVYLSSHRLMVRVRKNAKALTVGERDRLLNAIRTLHVTKNAYQIYQSIHSVATTEVHHVPAFLAWHRLFVLQYERALQKIDPSVAVPYWKYDEAAPQVFAPDFMGSNVGKLGPTDGEVTFALVNPLNGWMIENLTPISRASYDNHLAANASIKSEAATLAASTVDLFRDMEIDPHGDAHVWTGGWMQILAWSVRDPLFFLLHANVDRQWAAWQRLYDRYGTTADDYTPLGSYPNAGAATTHVGSYIDDTMWPWNGEVGTGDPKDLSQRPTTAPGGPFPPAAPFRLGPTAMPRVREAIDYLGRADPGAGLGFAYDDQPFEIPSEQVQLQWIGKLASEAAQTERAIGEFAARARPVAERLAAGARIGAIPDPRSQDTLVALVANARQDARIRQLALGKARGRATRALVVALTRIVSQPANGGEALKLAAIDRLRVIAEFSHVGHEMQEEILASWRLALGSAIPAVRLRALEALAVRRDQVALRALVAVLDATGAVSPTKAQAIGLLSLADPERHLAAFRAQLATGIADARVAAARALASDEASRPALKRIVADAAEPVLVRRAAILALAAGDRDFAGYALPLLARRSQHLDVRLAVMDGLAQVLNRDTASAQARSEIRRTLTAVTQEPASAVSRGATAVLAMMSARGK